MKILIQMTYMCAIGGIETAMYQFACGFDEAKEIIDNYLRRPGA